MVKKVINFFKRKRKTIAFTTLDPFNSPISNMHPTPPIPISPKKVTGFRRRGQHARPATPTTNNPQVQVTSDGADEAGEATSERPPPTGLRHPGMTAGGARWTNDRRSKSLAKSTCAVPGRLSPTRPTNARVQLGDGLLEPGMQTFDEYRASVASAQIFQGLPAHVNQETVEAHPSSLWTSDLPSGVDTREHVEVAESVTNKENQPPKDDIPEQDRIRSKRKCQVM